MDTSPETTPRDTPTPTTLEIDGLSWRVLDVGSGPPLVLLSGWPQSLHIWRHMVVPLAAGRRVIAIEPPGLGETDPLPEGHTSAAVARRIAAVLGHLGVARYDLVGHDIGAWIAYPLAHLDAARMRRLVVVDAIVPGLADPAATALSSERVGMVWHFHFNALPELPELLIAGREGPYLDWLLRSRTADFEATFTASDRAEYARLLARPGAISAGMAYYRAIFASAAHNRELARTQLSLPILAVGGGRWIGAAIGAAFSPVGTQVRAAVVEHAAHFVPEEAPQDLLGLIETFLGEAPFA